LNRYAAGTLIVILFKTILTQLAVCIKSKSATFLVQHIDICYVQGSGLKLRHTMNSQVYNLSTKHWL